LISYVASKGKICKMAVKFTKKSFLMAFLKLKRFSEKHLGIITQTFVNTVVVEKFTNHRVHAHDLCTGCNGDMI